MTSRIHELALESIVRYAAAEAWIFTDEELENFARALIQETIQVALAGVEFGPSVEEAVAKYFGVSNVQQD